MPLGPADEEAVLAASRALVEAPRLRGWKLATAESCTGGGIAHAVTSIAGSSDVFDRGFVTYTDASKVEMLGVTRAALAAHGAVSEAVARAMAEGALRASQADVAVAVTGIAGPGGATPGKPVGTVCFAWGTRGGSLEARTDHFAGDRATVRAASVRTALHGVIALASGRPSP